MDKPHETQGAAEIGYGAIEDAALRLQGIAHRTPVLTSRFVNEQAGAELFFKCENFQRGGAFKFRGAYNAIALLADQNRKRGVVAFSTGNHAQGVALAGRLQKVPTTIVMPKDAPEIKIKATKGYGSEIIFYDRYTENREEISSRLAAERGLTLIPPFDHPDVIAGQGTAVKELLEETGPLDAIFVCLGGGGLMAGSALAAHSLSPKCRIIGVEPEAGNDGQQSFRAGHIIEITAPHTIADGAATTRLGRHTFPIIQRLAHDMVTVTDDALGAMMRIFAERMKMIVEPTGCLAAAAAISGNFHQPGERIGVLVSGGNVDLALFARLIG